MVSLLLWMGLEPRPRSVAADAGALHYYSEGSLLAHDLKNSLMKLWTIPDALTRIHAAVVSCLAIRSNALWCRFSQSHELLLLALGSSLKYCITKGLENQ